MADTQGGLSLASTTESEAAPVAAPAPQANFEKVYEESQQRLLDQQRKLDARRDQLMSAMGSRRARLFDPGMMRLAAGLLAPTKTGSFAESLGYGVSGMADEQEREFARQQQEARLMYDLEQSAAQQRKEEVALAKENIEYNRQNKIRDLSGKLINFKTDPNTGAVSYTIDPKVAQQLTALTGDMKYADTMIADARKKAQQEIALDMFKEVKVPATDTQPERVVYRFNPQAVMNLARVSADPLKTITEVAEAIPKLRKTGLMDGISDSGTPFDVIAAMVQVPAIQAQAALYQKQYKAGIINDEQADKLAQQMLSLATSTMDKKEARDLQMAIHGLTAGIQKANQEANRAIRQDALQFRMDEAAQKKEAEKLKKSQEQKAIYDKADATIDTVEYIRNHPGRASGVWQAIRPTQLVPGTEAYNFNEQMQVLKSQSFLANVKEMKGLGALSNKEGDRIESAISRLNPKMSAKEFDKALDEIVTAMNAAKQRARDIAEGRAPTFDGAKPAAPAAAPTGRKPIGAFGG